MWTAFFWFQACFAGTAALLLVFQFAPVKSSCFVPFAIRFVIATFEAQITKVRPTTNGFEIASIPFDVPQFTFSKPPQKASSLALSASDADSTTLAASVMSSL